MPNEKRPNHLELVESLASSIHKKFVEPAEDRVELINNEIRRLNQQMSELEQKLAMLRVKQGRISLIAYLALAGIVLIVLGQVFWPVR